MAGAAAERPDAACARPRESGLARELEGPRGAHRTRAAGLTPRRWRSLRAVQVDSTARVYFRPAAGGTMTKAFEGKVVLATGATPESARRLRRRSRSTRRDSTSREFRRRRLP